VYRFISFIQLFLLSKKQERSLRGARDRAQADLATLTYEILTETILENNYRNNLAAKFEAGLRIC
jgi:hypothetical protein